MNLREQTTLLTLDEVADRIQFSPHTLAKWTSGKLSGWPQPIPCGPQRERRWREADIAAWIQRQSKTPAPKRKPQGALARKRKRLS